MRGEEAVIDMLEAITSTLDLQRRAAFRVRRDLLRPGSLRTREAEFRYEHHR
jgi:hypothetical protein